MPSVGLDKWIWNVWLVRMWSPVTWDPTRLPALPLLHATIEPGQAWSPTCALVVRSTPRAIGSALEFALTNTYLPATSKEHTSK